MDDPSSGEIKDALKHGCVTSLLPPLPVVASKCGIASGHVHDCAWIEDADVRYVIAVMSRLSTNAHASLYTKLCKELRPPHPRKQQSLEETLHLRRRRFALLPHRRNMMATISMTSNDGQLSSASAVLEVSATNPEYNQPVLRVKQAGTRGGAASIRIDDPNPDIEFVETDLKNPPDPGAGKFEIAVQADRLQINGRRAAVSPEETGIRHYRRLPAAGGGRQYRCRIQGGQPVRYVRRRTGRNRHCERHCRPNGERRRGRDFVRPGWGLQVSRVQWHGDSYRTGLVRGPKKNMQMSSSRRPRLGCAGEPLDRSRLPVNAEHGR